MNRARWQLLFFSITVLFIIPCTAYITYKLCTSLVGKKKISMEKKSTLPSSSHVIVKQLDNGLTVLIRPVSTVPKVAVQLWYGVGSRDEKDSERGIAHLIEHMIFKGTKKISESDINVLTHMLSGSCNAFTSYDYTGYLFNLPSYNWYEALPVMADCMVNCRFDEQMLSSEMKAVVQELKMYRDKYVSSLLSEMISAIFPDHPYRHPIIGYKQDLWSVTSDNLRAFYKKHYHPNNATLVIVGDVEPQEAFDRVQEHFGPLKPNTSYTKESYYHNKDIVSRAVTLYRDVKNPSMILTFVIPGLVHKKEHIAHIAAWVLGKGRGSRLYQKIVNESQLATSLDASADCLFDYGLFFITCDPVSQDAIPAIEKEVIDAINDINTHGIHPDEISRAVHQTQMSFYDTLEDLYSCAYQLGYYFLGTGDPDYLFNYINAPIDQLKTETEELITHYFNPTIMHKGFVLPLPSSDLALWHDVQEAADREDEKILSARIRTSPVEEARYATTIQSHEPSLFHFPQPTVAMLNNGLKVLYYRTTTTPKIDIILDFKVESFYDPEDKQGLCSFVARMLVEGTKNYTAAQLATLLEQRGISLSSRSGCLLISLPSQELSFVLTVLNEILTNATFPEAELEKVRSQMIAGLKNLWDSPTAASSQLIREHIYKNHPYHKNGSGTFESLEHISQKDCRDFYTRYMSPHGARLSIVGDFDPQKLIPLLEQHLGSWKGQPVSDITFPPLSAPHEYSFDHPMTRDQIVLTFARSSISRLDHDFDKLLLFDQIFGGGLLNSMNSRLFDLREQSGLFYTINGSFIVGADEQPGIFLVRTIVSLDRLDEAEKAIKSTIDTAIDTLTESELHEARNAVISSMIDHFASNHGIAEAFLFCDRFHLPFTYFDTRAASLRAIGISDIQKAVRKYAQSNSMLKLRVGRTDQLSNP